MPRKRPDQPTEENADDINLGGSIGDIVPGKELEKAAGQIATAAGKSAVRGIANALGAATAEYFAKRAAKAQVAKLAIKTEAEIERKRTLARAKRESDFEDIAHAGRIEVAKRALDRLLHELSYQQQNLESIGARSIRLLEATPNAKPRKFEADWLFAFAEVAQKISDEEIQELWARALASAATEEKTRLSPASLALMALLDRNTARQFDYFCKIVNSINSYPRTYSPTFGKLLTTPRVNVDELLEIGLIQVMYLLEYRFLDNFMFIESEVEPNLREKVQQASSPQLFESYVLSERGRQIFEATLGSNQHQKLGDDELSGIIHGVILDKVAHFGAVKILNRSSTVTVHRVLKDLAGLKGDLERVSPPILKAAVGRLRSNCWVEIL